MSKPQSTEASAVPSGMKRGHYNARFSQDDPFEAAPRTTKYRLKKTRRNDAHSNLMDGMSVSDGGGPQPCVLQHTDLSPPASANASLSEADKPDSALDM